MYEKNGFIHVSVFAPFYNDTPPPEGNGELYLLFKPMFLKTKSLDKSWSWYWFR